MLAVTVTLENQEVVELQLELDQTVERDMGNEYFYSYQETHDDLSVLLQVSYYEFPSEVSVGETKGILTSKQDIKRQLFDLLTEQQKPLDDE